MATGLELPITRAHSFSGVRGGILGGRGEDWHTALTRCLLQTGALLEGLGEDKNSLAVCGRIQQLKEGLEELRDEPGASGTNMRRIGQQVNHLIAAVTALSELGLVRYGEPVRMRWGERVLSHLETAYDGWTCRWEPFIHLFEHRPDASELTVAFSLAEERGGRRFMRNNDVVRLELQYRIPEGAAAPAEIGAKSYIGIGGKRSAADSLIYAQVREDHTTWRVATGDTFAQAGEIELYSARYPHCSLGDRRGIARGVLDYAKGDRQHPTVELIDSALGNSCARVRRALEGLPFVSRGGGIFRGVIAAIPERGDGGAAAGDAAAPREEDPFRGAVGGRGNGAPRRRLPPSPASAPERDPGRMGWLERRAVRAGEALIDRAVAAVRSLSRDVAVGLAEGVTREPAEEGGASEHKGDG